MCCQDSVFAVKACMRDVMQQSEDFNGGSTFIDYTDIYLDTPQEFLMNYGVRFLQALEEFINLRDIAIKVGWCYSVPVVTD